MIIEVCADSYEYAEKAEKAGADRIELCKHLHIDGLTPNYKTAKITIENCHGFLFSENVLPKILYGFLFSPSWKYANICVGCPEFMTEIMDPSLETPRNWVYSPY